MVSQVFNDEQLRNAAHHQLTSGRACELVQLIQERIDDEHSSSLVIPVTSDTHEGGIVMVFLYQPGVISKFMVFFWLKREGNQWLLASKMDAATFVSAFGAHAETPAVCQLEVGQIAAALRLVLLEEYKHCRAQQLVSKEHFYGWVADTANQLIDRRSPQMPSPRSRRKETPVFG